MPRAYASSHICKIPVKEVQGGGTSPGKIELSGVGVHPGRLNHRDPHVVLLALSVLDSCWSNCGPAFRKEVSSASFINELQAKATHINVVRYSAGSRGPHHWSCQLSGVYNNEDYHMKQMQSYTQAID
ncbi:hypothetical protein TELCIR_18496 [Teladorsagia circumcincta]|uniref:VHS domain-containing protein n=1 Tax=Teladorsagia circumcincta TaxID=45464 RepID=A0A2G9TPU5_TELCI|nr:hypothetical protein TELCIR_18496 [Teladorsagia circumcincta]